MTNANEVRGEVSIELDGAPYVLRPTYEALVAIETQTQCSLSILAMAAQFGTLSIVNAAIIVTECVKAQGKALLAADDPSGRVMTMFGLQRVGELILESGLKTVFAPLATLLRNAITGGYTATGEPKATATTTGTPAAA